MSMKEAWSELRMCCLDCFMKNGTCGENKREKCSVYIAQIALKKQIPEVPFLEGDGYADGVEVIDTWICPNCGKDYELECDEHDYCPNCGQAIDWEIQE